MPILQFLIVGLIAGWAMGKLRSPNGKRFGLLKSLVIGVIGSFIGWFLIGFLKVESPNMLAQLAMAVMGATLFSLLVAVVFGKKKKKSEDDEE